MCRLGVELRASACDSRRLLLVSPVASARADSDASDMSDYAGLMGWNESKKSSE